VSRLKEFHALMVAFTFPGQGSQRPGMGAPWTDHPSWELVLDASDVIGRDVAKLLLDADADELKLPRNTQLATFMLSMVVLDAVERVGLLPTLAAGHSLGEYTALTATGALSFEDGVRIVSERGEAMQFAADERPGTMTALLGISDDDADAACRRADGDVWVANYNAPGQVVIAGEIKALERAALAAKELGAKRAMPLPVGGAFHTPYMAPARERLREVLSSANILAPEVPVVANIDARPHDVAGDWMSLLSAQLVSPVRWRQSVVYMSSVGITTFIELGPGGVLTSLAKRTAPDAFAMSVAVPDDIDKLLETINGAAPVPRRTIEGEHLSMTVRMVVSPSAGIYQPTEPATPGVAVKVGGIMGHIGDVEVRSPFAGTISGMLAVAGERVTSGQPIAWLDVS
jgi:[acyl-carrier-protein] S-malonyltransferase